MVVPTPTGPALVISIADAHADLAYYSVRTALRGLPDVRRVSVYGTAGSLDTELPPGTWFMPAHGVRGYLQGPPRRFRARTYPVNQDIGPNGVPEGVRRTTHINVDNLLQEHRRATDWMIRHGITTADMELWHVLRAVHEDPRRLSTRAIFHVTDVATSAEHGAGAHTGSVELASRRQTFETEVVLRFLGLIP
jgi:hypothetical protein